MPADLNRPAYQYALNLNVRSINPVYLNGQVITKDDVLKKYKELNFPLLNYYMFVHAACVVYIFREYDLAAENVMNIKDTDMKFPGVYAMGVQAFYCGLSLFALASKKNQNDNKKFKKWDKYSPKKYIHKVMLLKYENSVLLIR